MTERTLIREALDVFTARRRARQLAVAVGFAPAPSLEIAIVVSELGTNILKYGVRGEIVVSRTTPPVPMGVEVVAEDEGPPIADIELAVRDGYGDRGPIDADQWLGRGGIGAGLGAVIRLSDSFEYHPGPGKKFFRAIRYLHTRRVVRV
ncbi:MAG: ATP-binding protein [Deltaproteobacteria bacterium]|nr:ATP-binding protein [Deltaproteobacteria bacterium]